MGNGVNDLGMAACRIGSGLSKDDMSRPTFFLTHV